MSRTRSKSLMMLVAVMFLALPTCNSSSSPTTPGGGGGAVMQATVTATSANVFAPAVVNLLPGGTVTFVNGGGKHNVNAGTFRCATTCVGPGSQPTEEGWSFTMTFPASGTVGYVCDEHANVGMTGEIRVQ